LISMATTKNKNMPRKAEKSINAQRAFLLAWPLIIALNAFGISKPQRLWIKSKLVLVSRITGSRTLEVVAIDVRSPHAQARMLELILKKSQMGHSSNAHQ
jgi:hypothetical protein